MIEMVEKKELIPENDMQELWQLSGRVQAVVAVCKAETNRGFNSVDASLILSILGK